MPISMAGSPVIFQCSKIAKSANVIAGLRTRIPPSASEGVETRLPICTSSVAPVTSSDRVLLLSPAPLGERDAQRLVAERRLPARVDHRFHRQAAEEGVHDQQAPAQESDRDGRVAARGALVLRAHDRDAVPAKVDVDALAREAVRAEHALGAAERVRHDRQAPRLHQEVAELQRFDRHERHLRPSRSRRAA